MTQHTVAASESGNCHSCPRNLSLLIRYFHPPLEIKKLLPQSYLKNLVWCFFFLELDSEYLQPPTPTPTEIQNKNALFSNDFSAKSYRSKRPGEAQGWSKAQVMVLLYLRQQQGLGTIPLFKNVNGPASTECRLTQKAWSKDKTRGQGNGRP